ncbi:UNVERIFIED_CONTAM: hypothetical protein GTU68_017189 [Idotea baltica]|nr:hypothetical protein [Idotea baltica]
MHLACQIQGL